jgi:predicted amidohydrolase YtcJ
MMSRDLVILNANIQTMDLACPTAQAMLIRAGRVVILGTDADVLLYSGTAARTLDAGGRLVLPGFQDAHVHLMDGGTDLIQSAWLGGVTTVTEMQSALADHAAVENSPLVMGGGWRATFFGDANLTRQVLDAVVPDRPCIIYDDSAHSACLNSAACTMAGLISDTPDPPNGHFVCDASGEPTGMLHEDAIYWARARLPNISDETHLQGARAGQVHANSLGITGVLDPSITDYQERAYAALAAEGAMTLRVAGAAKVAPDDTAESVVVRLTALRAAHRSEYFQIHSAKFFLDGVLENRTAVMLAPYCDALGGNADLMFSPRQIAEMFTALDAARFQIHVHVIGDGAARAALNGFEAALQTNGRWPGLHQLAHLQVVDPRDLLRISALGAMANIQPLWACKDISHVDPTQAMIGPDRAPNTYAFRQMLEAGAAYCLSSDWPVTTMNPFEIIETAVTRQPPGQGGHIPAFYPAERMTVVEAVLGYTVHAASACWRGHFTGRLAPGFSADLIMLDRDIFTCDAYEISQTQVLLTVFQGVEVHRHSSFEG